HVSIGMRQRVHRDLQDHLEPAWVRKGPRADGLANLGSVVPNFSELAPDVEPLSRDRFTRPGYWKGGVCQRVESLDEFDEPSAGVLVELDQHAGTEPPGDANPRRVEVVDESREILLRHPARSLRPRHQPVTLKR